MRTGSATPPHSVESEQIVLGSMLIDEEAKAKAMRILAADDFYQERHRTIFDAIASTQTVDVVTINESLERNKAAQRVGGIDYLAHLAGTVQTTQAVTAHANLVKEKSQYRRFIAAADQIADVATNESMDVLNLKGMAYELLDVKTDATTGTHITQAADTYKRILETRGKAPGSDIKTGIPWVDKHTGGFPNGASVIVAARPSVGKTTFVVQVARHNAYRGKRVLFFSIEMTETQIMDKLVAGVACIDSELLKTPERLRDDERQAINEAINELSELNIMIYDDVADIEAIKAICKQENAEHGVDMVAIDYMQIIESRRRYDSENARLTYISQEVKKIAKSLRCPVVTLSQLSRPRDGRNPEPTLSDLRGSGSIEQDADIVIFLHDPNAGDYDAGNQQGDMDLKLIIGKNREGQRDIAVTLQYQKPVQRIVERAYPTVSAPSRTVPQKQIKGNRGRQKQLPEPEPREAEPDDQEELPW